MIVRLHKLARTTPAIRAEIAASDESIQTLAQRYGVSPMTVFKWKHRTSFEDRPHTPHRLPTTLTAAQEIIAVQLRKTLLLSLDDLLAVMRVFVNPDASRSELDRCLRRHGAGYVHIDVKYFPQMADEDRQRYLVATIDRAQHARFCRLSSRSHRCVSARSSPKTSRRRSFSAATTARRSPTASLPRTSAPAPGSTSSMSWGPLWASNIGPRLPSIPAPPSRP